MEVIGTTNLSLIYGENDTSVEALKEVNLSIDKGELIAIMGPSGSGKSSLLHVLGAMLTPSSGKVRILGTEINRMSRNQLATMRRNHIGFIFQNFALIQNLDALSNVMTPLYPVNPPWLKARAEDLLTKVGLAERMHHKPEQLSGGEKQRVAIARALINSPDIIFGDEITGNLDTSTGSEIFNIVKKLNEEEEITFVIVTHDREVADKCQRTLRMRDGEII
ncbi:MAG: ABC transporter ATP-binding protein [Candidatus Heimdallarchaeota archaeon]|nr:ABC transporter ATP-binding protein [Candidatus Heimdallarchaeota archaeon]